MQSGVMVKTKSEEKGRIQIQITRETANILKKMCVVGKTYDDVIRDLLRGKT